MNPRIQTAKHLFVDLPKRVRLAYCLMRDPRVPIPLKALLASSLALIASPIKIPKKIPFLGELDILALTLASLNLYILACPLELVNEHEQKIVERQSIFDDDLRHGEDFVRQCIVKIVGKPRDEEDYPKLTEEV